MRDSQITPLLSDNAVRGAKVDQSKAQINMPGGLFELPMAAWASIRQGQRDGAVIRCGFDQWRVHGNYLSGPSFNWRAFVDFVQDNFDQLKLRFPVYIFEIDVAWPGGSDMVVYGKIDRFTDALDRIDE